MRSIVPKVVCCLAMLALLGCESQPDGETASNSSANVSPNQASSSSEGESTRAIDQDEASLSKIVPQIEDGAVNEAGQVVLSAPNNSGEANAATPTDASRTDASSRETDSNPPIAPEPEPQSIAASLTSETSKSSSLPPEANVTSAAERDQKIAEDWPKPQVVLFVSGQQHGYLEPCGCTGLDNQKGGLIRRDTLLSSLRERDWNIVPIDVGNQVRRIGRQPEIKFQATVEAFKTMGYQAAMLGIDDLKLSSVELIQAASSDDLNQSPFISANVSILDPSFFPDSRVIKAGGRKIGVTSILGKEFEPELANIGDIEFLDPTTKLAAVVQKLKKEDCDFIVLLAHASLEESASLARSVKGIDLVVTAGGYGEPTLRPEAIEGSEAVMVQVGTKGMYGGIVGLFDDPKQPIRYQKIAISSQFKDSERMLAAFADYQQRLKDAGFDALGATPVPHPTGREFVGSETCGDCHTTAFEIWQNSPHVHATESIVAPSNDRGGIARHFDPECVSCHVTGWNAQQYYPYTTGYTSLGESEHLLGSGCENCHGPGSQHVAAENGDIEADDELLQKLREQMQLPLARARDKCLECHDLDNSPDFHEEGAFDEYWEQVKHYGKD